MKSCLRPVILPLLLLVAACAHPASPVHMVVGQNAELAATNPAMKNAMSVGSVLGGKGTSALWASNVDNDAIKAALSQSLANASYLAADAGKYRIDVELMSLKQPYVAVTFKVVSKINYTVSGPNGKNTYPITATGTAAFGDATLGNKRLEIANERSIEENIKGFLVELKAVK